MQFPFARELWAVDVALLAWVFVWAVQAISHSCHVELLSATTSTALQTKPQIHDLLRLYQTTKFSLSSFFNPSIFISYESFFRDVAESWFSRDFLTILGLLVVHFKEVGKWQKKFTKKKRERNEKREVYPNTFVRRSQLKALRRNVDNEQQKNRKKSWSEKVDLTDRIERRECAAEEVEKSEMCVIIHKNRTLLGAQFRLSVFFGLISDRLTFLTTDDFDFWMLKRTKKARRIKRSGSVENELVNIQ